MRGIGHAIGAAEGHIGDAREIVTFAKDGENWIAEIVPKITSQQADKKLAENRRLFDPLHQEAAKGCAEGNENRSDQNRNDGIGMRELAPRKVIES